jgi:hypothetical protein
MALLLGHGATYGISAIPCALEVPRAELKTSACVGAMRTLIPEVFAGEVSFGAAGYRASHGSEGSTCSSAVSPRFNSSPSRSLLRGFCDARRHGAVLLSGLLSQSKSGPLSRMHGLALGSRAHSHSFA